MEFRAGLEAPARRLIFDNAAHTFNQKLIHGIRADFDGVQKRQKFRVLEDHRREGRMVTDSIN
jgi:hypothetical protein